MEHKILIPGTDRYYIYDDMLEKQKNAYLKSEKERLKDVSEVRLNLVIEACCAIKEIDDWNNQQFYFTPCIVNDPLVTLYSKDGCVVNYDRWHGYFDVLGFTEDEYNEISKRLKIMDQRELRKVTENYG